jgi:flagellar basal body-associated protein FliL
VKGEDKEQKGGFNPLYVIIPITVIILGAAIAAYVMMNRKQPAKPAQKETIDEGEDDYE